MSGLFFARAVAAFLTDGSIAIFTGLLLASNWLSRTESSPPFDDRIRLLLPLASGTLLVSQIAQLFLLTIEFSGASTVGAILSALQDVSTTHAGTIAAATAAASLLLLLVSLLPRRRVRQSGSVLLLSLLLGVVLLLRSASGHASTEGNFSLAELLQFLHLVGMAVWSGGVIVSGLLIVPGWQGAQADAKRQGYLRELSRAATVAVAVVFLSGLCKSYRAAEGNVSLLLGASWGYVLLVKLLFVVLALVLGAINRRWIHGPGSWEGTALRKSAIALRWEAWCMTAVIALSAVLGNLSPPRGSS